MSDLRDAIPDDLKSLAQLWHEGWHDAHAAIISGALTRLRTPESFEERLQSMLSSTRVIGLIGEPIGFCSTKTNEIDQLFVAESARGTGAARWLLSDSENRLRDQGTIMAQLACAIGNDRAARFYEKNGWHIAGTVVDQVETVLTGFTTEVWCFEKHLLGASTKDL